MPIVQRVRFTFSLGKCVQKPWNYVARAKA